MNNNLNTLDDLFDREMSKALRELGFIFPQTVEDFQRIENELKFKPLTQPDKLKDPMSFLGKTHRKPKLPSGNVDALDLNDYSSNLAQAAREGKEITEDVKRQMEEDKKKSKKSGN